MGNFLRIVASFATVGLLLWVFARASKGRLGELLSGATKGTKAEPIAIVDRRQLAKNSAVAIVRAGSRHLLIGFGDGGTRLLAEGDDLVTGLYHPGDPEQATIGQVTASRPPANQPAGGEDRAERADAQTPDLDASLLDLQRLDQGSAWTRLRRAPAPCPPRTSVIEALRTRTVRRS